MGNIRFGIGLGLYPAERIIRETMLAEKYGFDSVWKGDHVIGHMGRIEALSAWVMTSYLSTITRRVRTCLGPTDPFRLHPAVFAQMGATLDIISNGRFTVALGAGEAMNLIPYGIALDKPVSRMGEFIKVVRSLWTKEYVSSDGDFYKLSNAPMEPKPIQKPLPPIWIAGNSPRTLRLTGRLGDGWLPFRISPELFEEDLKVIKQSAEKAGRDPGSIEPGVWILSAISRDGENAREAMEETGKLLLVFTPKNLERMGYKIPEEFDLYNAIVTKESLEHAKELAKQVPSEAVKKCCAFGTPEDCIAMLENYVKAGARHFVILLMNPSTELDQAIELYGREVIPHFNNDR